MNPTNRSAVESFVFLEETVQSNNGLFLQHMDALVHTLNNPSIPGEVERLTALGRVLEGMLFPEPPTIENWKESVIPVRPALLYPNIVPDMAVALTAAGKRTHEDDLFIRVLDGLIDTELPTWAHEMLTQGKFDNFQRLYFMMLDAGAVGQVEAVLDQMVAMTCNCDEPDNDAPEARFTRDEQERFNATLPRLIELGIPVDAFHPKFSYVDCDADVLSSLGEEKGYFEGFTADE